MNPSGAKGTKAETALVSFLLDRGYSAERRSRTGSHDQGDISFHDYPWLAVEVKNVRTPSYRQWLREAEVERLNAGAELGVVIHKPHGLGLTSQGDWIAAMTVNSFLTLLGRGE